MTRIQPILLACTAALLTTLPAQARTLVQIKESGVLRVATPGDVPPFSMTVEGRNTGFEVELLNALAADLGVKVSYRTARIDQLTKLVQDDEVDLAVSALGITSTREKKTDFAAPSGCFGVSVISLDPNMNKHTDLAGKKVGVIAGSIMTSYVQKLPFQKQVNVYPSNNDVVIAIFSKAVDATIAYSVSEPIVKKLYPKAPVHFSPELWTVPVGMMLNEQDDSTRLALNASLRKLQQSGTYAQISQKYFGKDVRCKE
ncbi:substrate-binding periplasmic protein [Deinococcus hopiensis]|uniref:Polar amino acid transport system substrate-binding protein n=1 Tax=Deinococcus hopiensis KR-140 TaxID=695939 RepID=A0A1W1VLC7_9DEIO|nr:transporter substrate-binding domain-containing protein [Deinococcus hopiensis]SMB93764.1 polar amino acid transport system substrate-binding protein [Deinococcus hopiensis KR-140]